MHIEEITTLDDIRIDAERPRTRQQAWRDENATVSDQTGPMLMSKESPILAFHRLVEQLAAESAARRRTNKRGRRPYQQEGYGDGYGSGAGTSS